MTQDTTPAIPSLLVELWRLLAAHRPAVGQARCFARLCALVLGFLLGVARPTGAPSTACSVGSGWSMTP